MSLLMPSAYSRLSRAAFSNMVGSKLGFSMRLFHATHKLRSNSIRSSSSSNNSSSKSSENDGPIGKASNVLMYHTKGMRHLRLLSRLKVVQVVAMAGE